MSLFELGETFSDYHKDTYGFRPRNVDFSDRDELMHQLNIIHTYHDRMNETFAGREHLRDSGWIVQETDANLQQHAYWLARERDEKFRESCPELWRESGAEARHYLTVA